MGSSSSDTSIYDLSFLTVFSVAAVIAAAVGRDATLAGATIAAVSLGGLLFVGWRHVSNSSGRKAGE